MFANYKPTSYNAIKDDYDLIELVESPQRSELFPELDFSGLGNEDKQSPATMSTTIDIDLKALKSSITQLKESVESPQHKQAFADLAAVFKCFICLEVSPTNFYSCPFCGRFLGCFNCLKNVKKCPVCRKNFCCVTCTTEFPKNPLILPGISEFVPCVRTTGTTEIDNIDHDGNNEHIELSPDTDIVDNDL